MAEAATKPKRARKPKAATVEPTIVGYKGFDKNLACRGYQFEVGKTFEHAGKVEACASGFHACENPLDVLNYYGIGDDNRFCRVTLGGSIARHDGDSKVAAAKLTVEAELRLPDFIKAGIAWIIDAAKSAGGKDDKVQAASGDYSQLAASGYSSKLAASGYSSKLAASGDYSQLAASGYYSQLAASGYYSQLAASGYSSKLAASGYSSKLAASGDSSKLAASGYSSKLEITGANGVIAAAAPNCTAKGVDGTWIALPEFDRDGKCIGFATGCVGQDGLEAGVSYAARGGKLVRA